LSGVEDRRSGASLFGREPGRDDAAVGGKAGGFGEAYEKAKGEQGDDRRRRADHPDAALQAGEKRPDGKTGDIDAFRSEAVEQPAARELPDDISPAESGKDIAHGHGIKAKIFCHGGAGDGNRGAICIVDRSHNKYHQQNKITQLSYMRLRDSAIHAHIGELPR